jgi:hypothetical protein
VLANEYPGADDGNGCLSPLDLYTTRPAGPCGSRAVAPGYLGHFYEHGLGWQPSSASNAQVAFFQTGGTVLALYGKAALAQDAHLSHEG